MPYDDENERLRDEYVKGKYIEAENERLQAEGEAKIERDHERHIEDQARSPQEEYYNDQELSFESLYWEQVAAIGENNGS